MEPKIILRKISQTLANNIAYRLSFVQSRQTRHDIKANGGLSVVKITDRCVRQGKEMVKSNTAHG